MILRGIIIAIYLKSVFPPNDSNIKFYNATVLKMLKSKLRFIKKWLKQKRCALGSKLIFFKIKKIRNM